MEIKKFLGLRNTSSAERLAPGHLVQADNVDMDDTGKLQTRLGTTLARAGSYHSLWADGDIALVAKNGTELHRLNPDYTTTLLSRLLANRRISYNRQLNTVYFSNGVDKGRVVDGAVRLWGMQPPVAQPVASTYAGGLPAGRYQYALTFRRASGIESGTGVAGVIELAAPSGIAFSSIESSADPEVYDKVLYLSGPNGTTMFRLAVLPNSAASFNYLGSGSELSIRLETQFDNPPPPGDIVESYNGMMYVVSGSVAWHSRAYQFERFCFHDQFLQFPGHVTMFAAVNDGIYVSIDDTTWFLSGTGPGDFKSKVVFDYGAIPGTAAKTTVSVLKTTTEEQEGAPSGTAVMWATSRGICFGSEGGNAINMTETSYSLPSAPRGAGIIREARGFLQYLVALEGAETPASDAAQ